jgi:hypothetical protein
MAASTSLCAFDGSFAAGLLESAAQALRQQTSVLLVSSDIPYPEPLNSCRPMAFSFATGLVINPVQSQHTLARLSLSLTQETPSRLSSAHWENIRMSNPSARALPLLAELANPAAGATTLHLDYLSQCSLTIQLEKMPT